MALKIGIVAQEQPNDKFGVNSNYLEFIYQFGFPIIILPNRWEDFIDIYKIDALVLPGGADVNVNRYSEVPKLGTGSPNIYLEHFDTAILPNLIGKIPIFGICRGLQTLNVHFGGTLKNLYFHKFSISDTDEVHKVCISGDKKDKLKFGVNSFHHQGINKLADNFTIEAMEDAQISPVIEAISDYKNKIFAVQWHPERLGDNYSYNKFFSILK